MNRGDFNPGGYKRRFLPDGDNSLPDERRFVPLRRPCDDPVANFARIRTVRRKPEVPTISEATGNAVRVSQRAHSNGPAVSGPGPEASRSEASLPSFASVENVQRVFRGTRKTAGGTPALPGKEKLEFVVVRVAKGYYA